MVGINITNNNTIGRQYNRTYDPACASVLITDDERGAHLSNIVLVTCSFVFVVVGFIGNLLSVAVFSSESMRKISSNVYLLMLAVSDTLYLASVVPSKLVPMLACWGVVSVRLDVVNQSEFACVTLQYLDDLFADFSTCMILAFTVERCVAVYRPTRLKQICTVIRARVTSAIVLLAVTVSIAPHHVLYMALHRDPNACTIVEDGEATFAAMYTAESAMFRVLPIAIVATLNVFIIVRVRAIARKKNRLRSRGIASVGPAYSQIQAQPTDERVTSILSANLGIELQVCCAKKANDQIASSSSSSSHGSIQLTLTLIIVSTTYILLHIPVLIHFLVTELYRVHVIDLNLSNLFITQNYCRLLYVGGFAINFFLYTISGSVFREQLSRMFSTLRRDLGRVMRAGGSDPGRVGLGRHEVGADVTTEQDKFHHHLEQHTGMLTVTNTAVHETSKALTTP